MHSWFVTHRKKYEEVDFVNEEFLHKKINKNGLYMWICATQDILDKHVVKRQPESSIMEIWQH